MPRKKAILFGRFVLRPGIPNRSYNAAWLVLLTLFPVAISPAFAQSSSQQYVYLSLTTPSGAPPSAVSGFSKASQTGGLRLISGSPFNERLEGGLMAIDGQGKFLFVLNPTSDDISMFQIDQATGALFEVPGSPFKVPPDPGATAGPSQPVSIAGEASGKFVFVAYASGSFPPNGELASLSIDTSGSSPILRTQQTTQVFNASPVRLLTDSKGLRLYVGLGAGPSGTQMSGPQVYSISAVGDLAYEGTAPNPENYGFDFAIDPQNRFIFAAGGLNGPYYIESCVISPVDGTASTCPGLLYLGFSDLGSMVVESSGHFLYVPSSNGGVVAYSIDPATGAPTQVASFPGLALPKGSSVADPMGPFIYSADPSNTGGGGVHVYQVNSVTGDILEIPGSPFSSGVPGCCEGIAISGSPVQAVSGPAATIFPSSAATFSTVAGNTSSTQIFQIVNVGNATLSINSISIAGSGASSFSQSNTCLATLAANANCSVSITFSPASVGSFTASLQVADNAPGSPQTLALSGTCLVPQPAISFSLPSLTWGATTEGTFQRLSLAIYSTGNAPLHVSSVSVTGPNASDFSYNNGCIFPLAPGSTCNSELVFSPLAPGQRTATLVISDDSVSPASPQTISLTGTANPAFSAGPAPGGSTTASVSAGQTAQFQLQLTPGPGFTGTVSLSCTGAPLGALCQAPSTLSLANANTMPFTVTVSTSGPALAPPSTPIRFRRPPLVPALPFAMVVLLLVFLMDPHCRSARTVSHSRVRFALAGILAAFSLAFGFAGCGGGSAAVGPPPTVTPSGTYTVTVNFSANTSSGQPLQLSPIQLTLVVK